MPCACARHSPITAQLAAAGGWPELPAGTACRPDSAIERVALLRDRLRISGDFSGIPATADAWFFDAAPAAGTAGFPAAPRPARLRPARRAHAHGTQRSGQRSRYSSCRPRSPAGTGCRATWNRAISGSTCPSGSLEFIEQRRDRPADADHCRASRAGPRRASRTQSGRSSSIHRGPCRTPSPSRICCRPSRPIPTSSRGSASVSIAARTGRPRGGCPQDRLAAVSPDRFPYRLLQQPGPLNSLGRYKLVHGQSVGHLPARHAIAAALRPVQPHLEFRLYPAGAAGSTGAAAA